jgi:hypothetical protein
VQALPPASVDAGLDQILAQAAGVCLLAGQNPALELRQLGQWLRKVGEHQPNVAMSPDKLSPSRPPCG